MASKNERVGLLKKIELSIQISSGHRMRPSFSEPLAYTFIYGIGQQGLAPFEQHLVDQPSGSHLTMRLKAGQVYQFFQHLHLPLPLEQHSAEALFINVQINRVTAADPREVVKALAQGTGCGCDCGCGCH